MTRIEKLQIAAKKQLKAMLDAMSKWYSKRHRQS